MIRDGIPRRLATIAAASIMMGATAVPAHASGKRHTRVRASVRVSGTPTAGTRTKLRLAIKRPKHLKLKSFKLRFGDGKSVHGRRLPRAVRHVYREAGRFTVKLTVTDRHHHKATARVRLTVVAAPAPSPQLTGDPNPAQQQPPATGPTPAGSTPTPTPGPTATTTPAPTAVPTATPTPLRQQLTEWVGTHPTVGQPSAATGKLTETATLGAVPHLYPGALVQGDGSDIAQGNLNPIPLKPGSGTLTLHGAHLMPTDGHSTVNEHVTTASEPNVTDAVNTLTSQSFQPNSAQSVSAQFSRETSAEHAEFDAHASFSYGLFGGADATFQKASSTTENHVLFTMRQNYYTVSYSPDTAAGSGTNNLEAFFAPDVTTAQAQACGCMSTDAPPMYVSSVTYGSHFLLMVDSKASVDDITESLNAAFSYGLAHGSATVTSKQRSVLESMKITVYAVGGDSSSLAKTISGTIGSNGQSVLDQLSQYVAHTGNDAERSQPIAYTLAYIDDQPVGLYAPNPAQSSPLPNGYVSRHMKLTFDVGDNDKDDDIPVTVTLTVAPNNTQVFPSGYTFANGQLWDDNTTHNQVITLPSAVPIYDLIGAKLTVNGPGPSWRSAVIVAFDDPDGAYHTAYTSKTQFWNDDNDDPCGIATEYSTFAFTIKGMQDPAALTPTCGVGQ